MQIITARPIFPSKLARARDGMREEEGRIDGWTKRANRTRVWCGGLGTLMNFVRKCVGCLVFAQVSRRKNVRKES